MTQASRAGDVSLVRKPGSLFFLYSQPNSKMPLAKELMVIAHHTPLRPSQDVSTAARGMRAAVSVTLTMEGGRVVPAR